MAKIIALDIGGKRTGIAETDFLQMIAVPREMIETEKLIAHLREMLEKDPFEKIIVGDPVSLEGEDSHNSENVRNWVKRLKEEFSGMEIILEDERFSSKIAVQNMIRSGMKKMRRRNKGEIDKMSAAVILRSYMDRR